MRSQTDLAKEVNRSGFPLQIAVEDSVARSKKEHGWTVLHREHAWQHPAGLKGFSDLILEDRHRSSVLVVECKRVLDSDWIFLAEQDPDKTTAMRLWVNNTADHGKEHTGYFDVRSYPPSFESNFCVVPGSNSSDRPLLERVAADVLFGTESLALEEFPYLAARKFGFRCYASIIVTTASLHLSQINPTSIDLATGTASSQSISPVPWLRFRKQFTPDFAVQPGNLDWSFTDLATAREKVVFVVHATELSGFLKKWSFDSSSFQPLM